MGMKSRKEFAIRAMTMYIILILELKRESPTNNSGGKKWLKI